jgi:hypothetical protein
MCRAELPGSTRSTNRSADIEKDAVWSRIQSRVRNLLQPERLGVLRQHEQAHRRSITWIGFSAPRAASPYFTL